MVNHHKYLVWLVLLLLILNIPMNAIGADGSKAEAMEAGENVRYVLYVEAVAQGGSAELRVNDIPVGTVHGDGKLFSCNVATLLLPGKNIFSILPTESSGTIESRIVAYRLDEFVDGQGGRTFLYLKSENGERKSTAGKLSEQREKWSWCSNDRLSERDKSDALKAVKEIYRAFKEVDSEALTSYLDPIFSDLGKVSPDLGKDAYVKHTVGLMENIKGKEIWKFKEMDESQVVLVPVADSRLFDVRRVDGTRFFRTDQKSRSEWFSIWSMIGRQNGEWKIYR